MIYSTNKKSVQMLVDLLAQHHIKYAVISPGSRNAPLIIALNQHPEIQALSIADERVAAFFALGMAQKLRTPVAIVSTSGSAVLNFAPAISEAYYQQIPLLVLTADRPDEMINQSDGQAIVQHSIFNNYIKKSFHLPLNFQHERDLWYANRQINEAINLCTSDEFGPVHINIPLREPLYDKVAGELPIQRKICTPKSQKLLNTAFAAQLHKKITQTAKIMILVGILEPDNVLRKLLQNIAQLPNIVVLTETTSNMAAPEFVNTTDRVLASIPDNETELFQPNLLITFGKSVISKRIKNFLRQTGQLEHWSVGEFDYHPDTYMHVTEKIDVPPLHFLMNLQQLQPSVISDYAALWGAQKAFSQKAHAEYMRIIPWCDFKAYQMVFENIPENIELQAANSSPVRYAQLFDLPEGITCHSNRGTSGIDGCTSTAAGYAFLHRKPTVLVTGDISFLYDSNALWNNNLTPNLKIILINNQGGSIFRFIPGPSETEELSTFFETTHTNIKIDKLVEAFGLSYFRAENELELQTVFSRFYAENTKAAVLEIVTPRELNDFILKNYFKELKIKMVEKRKTFISNETE